MLSLGLSLTGIPVLGRRGPAYDPDALALFARFTTQPDAARKKLYSDLIASLKTAGVWPKLDALYILAAADAQAARQNLVANAYNLTAVGSPAFTADRGYQGDGVGAYLATGFVPSTANGKFSLNSAHMGVWSRTDAAAGGTEIGARTTGGLKQSILQARSALNLMNSRLNQGGGGTPPSVTGGLGHSVVARTSSTNLSRYRDGAALASDTIASSALTEFAITILAQNESGTLTEFSSRQLPVAHMGAGLAAPEAASLYSALNTYLTAVGAA